MTLNANKRLFTTCSLVVIVFITVAGFFGPGESAASAAGEVGAERVAGTEEKTAVVLSLDADSLITGIERYIGSIVETVGLIVHVCGVDGKKMKLQTAGGYKIKIVPGGSYEKFDRDAYGGKRVKVRGAVSMVRIDRPYIEKTEEARTVLCHVDYTPCIDADWIARHAADGTADSISIRTTNRLRESLKNSEKDYVPVVIIAAESCEVIEEAGDQ